MCFAFVSLGEGPTSFQGEEAKNQELAIKQQGQLEEMMPSVIEKVDVAEDEVQKVAIAAAPLQVEALKGKQASYLLILIGRLFLLRLYLQ